MPLFRFISLVLSLEGRRSALAFLLLVGLTLTEGIGLVSLTGLVGMLDLEGMDRMTSGPLAWSRRLLGEAPTLGLVLSVFVAALILRALSGLAFGMLTARIQAGLTAKLRGRLYEAVCDARWEEVQSLSRSRLHNALSGAPNQLAYAVEQALYLALVLAVVGVAGVMAVSVNGTIVLVVALVVGGLAIPMFVFDRIVARLSRSDYLARDRLYDHIGRYLDNLKLDRFLSRGAGGGVSDFEAASEGQAEAQRRIMDMSFIAEFAHQFGAVVALALIIYFGAGLDISTGEAAIIVVLFARMLPRLASAHSIFREILGMSAVFGEYAQQLDHFRAAAEPRAGRAAPLVATAPEIALEGITYAYPDGTVASRDVSLTLKAGRVTALMGLSGAGKTTLADIASGLLVPQKGTVRVDGRALGEGDLAAWRRCVSMVTRDDFLVPDTIRANIALGAAGLEEAAIWEALELVDFAGRVRAMPEGLDTMLGDRGHTLSAGERQRIALARALARRPLVLVMDEATSALNPLDEAAIVARLERLKGRMTVLLIAHRASSVTRADHVAVLEEGVLTEEGSLSSMLARPSSFVNRMAAAGTLTGEAAE